LDATTGIVRYYKYAGYTTTWSRADYANSSKDAWTADVAGTFTMFLQSDATASQETRSMFAHTYDVDNTTVFSRTWLEKNGVHQTSANLLGASTLTFFDGNTPILTQTDNLMNSNGFYEFSYSNAAVGGTSLFTTGKIYTAESSIVFNGTAKKTSHPFSITEIARLKVLDTSVSGVQTDVDNLQALLGQINDVGGTSLFGKVLEGITASQAAQTAAAASQTESTSVKTLVGSSSDTAATESLFGKLKEKEDIGLHLEN